MSNTSDFIPLKGFENDYEIQASYPFDIGNAKTHPRNNRVVTSRGIIINLNGKVYFKHKIIAEYFFNDFTSWKRIYHKKGNKQDNHLENLTYYGWKNKK